METTGVANLAFAVFAHARANPMRIALVVEGRQYSYEELAAAAGRIAGWLRAGSADGRNLRVGILAARSFETYAGILGALWAGGAYVPLNPRQPTARLKMIAQKARIQALVADRRGAAHLHEVAGAPVRRVLVGDGAAPAPCAAGAATFTTWSQLDPCGDAPTPVRPADPAYVIFTSGTTGVPKGVVVTVGNVAHFVSSICSLYRVSSEDRIGQFCETSFDASVQDLFVAWHAGASLHVVPEGQLLAPGGFITRQQLTIWSSVPSVVPLMAQLKQLGPGALASLRVSIFGGEGLSVALARTWQAAAPHSVVDNQYGPTEATVACTYQRLTEPPAETPGRGTLAIGQALPGLAAEIVGTDGRFLEDGTTGELAISGPQLAWGYLDDPEQTAQRFVQLEHPRHGPGRWYLTGDLALRDAEGRLHCLGRADNQVRVMGHRVELEGVEAHLRRVCGTEAVAAVAWPAVGNQASGIVAFTGPTETDPAIAREELRRHLPPYMVPRTMLMLDSLPLSANGKVDRQALVRLLERKAGDADA